jgi:hypothetical protein
MAAGRVNGTMASMATMYRRRWWISVIAAMAFVLALVLVSPYLLLHDHPYPAYQLGILFLCCATTYFRHIEKIEICWMQHQNRESRGASGDSTRLLSEFRKCIGVFPDPVGIYMLTQRYLRRRERPAANRG